MYKRLHGVSPAYTVKAQLWPGRRMAAKRAALWPGTAGAGTSWYRWAGEDYGRRRVYDYKDGKFMLAAQEDPDPTAPTTALGRKWWVVGNNRTRSPRFEVCDGQGTATLATL